MKYSINRVLTSIILGIVSVVGAYSQETQKSVDSRGNGVSLSEIHKKQVNEAIEAEKADQKRKQEIKEEEERQAAIAKAAVERKYKLLKKQESVILKEYSAWLDARLVKYLNEAENKGEKVPPRSRLPVINNIKGDAKLFFCDDDLLINIDQNGAIFLLVTNESGSPRRLLLSQPIDSSLTNFSRFTHVIELQVTDFDGGKLARGSYEGKTVEVQYNGHNSVVLFFKPPKGINVYRFDCKSLKIPYDQLDLIKRNLNSFYQLSDEKVLEVFCRIYPPDMNYEEQNKILKINQIVLYELSQNESFETVYKVRLNEHSILNSFEIVKSSGSASVDQYLKLYLLPLKCLISEGNFNIQVSAGIKMGENNNARISYRLMKILHN